MFIPPAVVGRIGAQPVLRGVRMARLVERLFCQSGVPRLLSRVSRYRDPRTFVEAARTGAGSCRAAVQAKNLTPADGVCTFRSHLLFVGRRGQSNHRIVIYRSPILRSERTTKKPLRIALAQQLYGPCGMYCVLLLRRPRDCAYSASSVS